MFSYSKRTDLSSIINAKIGDIETLLVTGAKTPHIAAVYTTHKSMNKKKTTLLVVDDVSDVLTEAVSLLYLILKIFYYKNFLSLINLHVHLSYFAKDVAFYLKSQYLVWNVKEPYHHQWKKLIDQEDFQ